MKIPIIYIIGAIIFGVIASAGIVAMTYHPPAIQVELHQYPPVVDPYAPAPVPQPAVPTIAPVVTSADKFAPAPAPVIVTTAPVPTITAQPVATVGMCDPSNLDPTNSLAYTQCVMEETLAMSFNMLSIFPLIFGLILVFGVLRMLTGLLDGGRGGSW